MKTTPRWRKSGGLIGLLLLAACASPQAPPLEQALQDEVQPAASGVPYRLAIAPLEMKAEVALPPAGDDATWSPVRPAPDLEDALVQAVGRSGLFQSANIQRLERPGSEQIESLNALFAVPAPVPREALLREALAREADLLLELQVERHAVRYVGRNGWFIPTLVALATFIWPAWFVADEQYAGEIDLRARLVAVGSETVVWERVLQAAPVKDLDDFDRGWLPLGTILVPGDLTADNYAGAGEQVMPDARNELAVALAQAMADLGPELTGAAFSDRLSKTLLVTIGVGRTTTSLSNLHVASDDARRWDQLLRSRGLNGKATPEAAGIPERNTSLLVEAEPTRARILEALARAASLTGPDDRLIVYYSGNGFSSGGKPYLCPSDLDPMQPLKTGLSLQDLATALKSCRGKQLIVLETSFAGTASTSRAVRTLKREYLKGLPAEEPPPPGTIKSQLATFAGTDRCVVLATAAGGSALEISPVSDDKLGLFTARMLDAMEKKGTDGDGDGLVTISEAFTIARGQTVRLSSRAGLAQTPERFGEAVNPPLAPAVVN